MVKKIVSIACLITAVFFIATSASKAADEPSKKESFGRKTKNFVQKLFSYPANVIQGSVDVIADTGKRGAEVVTNEVKLTGEVATGDVDKVKELVTEPLTGTAETVVKAVEETAQIPVEAAKEQ